MDAAVAILALRGTILPLPTVSRRTAVLALGALALVAAALCVLLPQLAQDQAFHRFADRRTLLGIPHALNVLSNAPFVGIGVLGLFRRRRPSSLAADTRLSFAALFLGLALVGFGSAYYHLAPGDERLVWDRLPITMVAMSLFSLLLIERLGPGVPAWLVIPLLALGAASVVVWRVTGDLWFYGCVQFFPMLAALLLLVVRPARYGWTPLLVAILVAYGLAKLVEGMDRSIYSLGGVVSGHTLKHLFAAAAGYGMLRMAARHVSR